MVAGYDSGVCLVYGMEVSEEPVQKRLDELFSIKGTWVKSEIKQRPGSRWKAYEFPQPNGSTLRAATSVRDMKDGKVLFMTTVTRSNKTEDD